MPIMRELRLPARCLTTNRSAISRDKFRVFSTLYYAGCCPTLQMQNRLSSHDSSTFIRRRNYALIAQDHAAAMKIGFSGRTLGVTQLSARVSRYSRDAPSDELGFESGGVC